MISLANETAIFFNHKNGTATLVSYDGELDTLRSLLDVNLVDVIRFDSRHVIFVDDEGFDKRYEAGFLITHKNRQIKFVGSGLLVGDNNGENAPLRLGHGDLKIDVLKLTYETREETTGQEEGV